MFYCAACNKPIPTRQCDHGVPAKKAAAEAAKRERARERRNENRKVRGAALISSMMVFRHVNPDTKEEHEGTFMSCGKCFR